MTDDWVAFEDSATNSGISSGDGDFLDGANLGSYRYSPNDVDYVQAGLSVTVDYTTPSFNLSDGKAVISEQSAVTVNTAETRDQGVAFAVEVSARTGISLTDSAVNYVFLEIDQSGEDALNIVVNTTDSAPSGPSIKIAEVDTSADTLTELNRNPDLSAKSLTVNGQATFTGTGTGSGTAAVFDSNDNLVKDDGPGVDLDVFEGRESGAVSASNQGIVVIDNISDTETVEVYKAALTLATGEPVPSNVDLKLVTLDNSGAFTTQTTLLTGDGTTVFDSETGSPLGSYTNSSGSSQTIAVVVDNQSASSQEIIALVEGVTGE